MDKLKSVGKAFQKINLAHLIDERERQQEIAYQLEHVNEENIAEIKRKEMVKEAVAACKSAMKEHLHGFIRNCPDAVYEEWIRQLHPENADFEDDRIDHRYYTEDSDHRHMWNEYMMEREIDSAERIVDSKNILPTYVRKSAGNI
eukprot:67246_1